MNFKFIHFDDFKYKNKKVLKNKIRSTITEKNQTVLHNIIIINPYLFKILVW